MADTLPATDMELAALEAAAPVNGMVRIHPDKVAAYLARLRIAEDALRTIVGFGNVNLASEWEHGLRDIIRSMTDCARNALNNHLGDNA